MKETRLTKFLKIAMGNRPFVKNMLGQTNGVHPNMGTALMPCLHQLRISVSHLSHIPTFTVPLAVFTTYMASVGRLTLTVLDELLNEVSNLPSVE